MEAVRRCVLGSPEFPFVLKSYKKQKKKYSSKKRQQVVRSTKIFEQKGRNPFILFKQTKHHCQRTVTVSAPNQIIKQGDVHQTCQRSVVL